jgi:hypothetical protein
VGFKLLHHLLCPCCIKKFFSDSVVKVSHYSAANPSLGNLRF